MIPKCFGVLSIKSYLLRYRGTKRTVNDTENRTELVPAEDEDLTQNTILVVLVTSRRQSW